MGLQHLLRDCVGCEDIRSAAAVPVGVCTLAWALRGTDDMDLLATKVKLVGLCAARFVFAMGGGGTFDLRAHVSREEVIEGA